MASSKRWASSISFVASLLHFFIIILQVPLFRVPCRIGTCTSPLQLTTSQLIATEVFPAFSVKLLLYPGALAQAFIKKSALPSYSEFLKQYSFNILKKSPSTGDLNHLEILAGSYLSVAGAILGLIRTGRMSLFGALLIFWGFIREAILRKSAFHPVKAIHFPAMLITTLSAFLSIRQDVKKLVRICKTHGITKSLQSKEKYK
ncbi:hypothetical protein K2173_024428 [Erythroxylum novogranatense]|uniref:Uncharacterized protein n=1 Tax=Erythroxylum novogranatense TaxID=1862640 RepID=A0AAV8SVC7_9ROSI|nr:hypothetical protein K2173_024428 [Erythroxylum novogranatense]